MVHGIEFAVQTRNIYFILQNHLSLSKTRLLTLLSSIFRWNLFHHNFDGILFWSLTENRWFQSPYSLFWWGLKNRFENMKEWFNQKCIDVMLIMWLKAFSLFKKFADKAICKLCFDEECFRYTFSDKTIYWCIFIECQTVKSMFCFTLLCSTIPTMVQCTAWSCIQMEVAKKVRCPSVFPVITEWRMADGLWHKAKGCYP